MEECHAKNSNLSVLSSQQRSEGTSSDRGHDANMTNKADKCSICLGVPMFNEASLDGCPHKYCYPCITEWIKLRPICPMCKRPVAKIIHQMKKDDNDVGTIEEVTVEAIQRQAIRERIEADSVRPLTRERAELVRRIRHLQRLVRLHDHTFNERQRSEMLGGDNRRHEYVDRINRYQLLLDNWERPRREVISDPAFRVLVYELRLQRVPVVNTTSTGTRRNSISPQYFRENEINERTRISEFVQRELNAVVPGVHNLEYIVERVYDLAKIHQIMSPQFTSCLRKESSALVNFVDHFVELLYEFAVSGQEMDLFDQNSEYINRIEYRRRLTNMNLVLFGGNINDNDVQVELDGFYAPNRNQASGRISTQDHFERMSPSHLHFVSAYTDALISLRRFLLILETTDEILPPNEENALGETIEGLVQAYVEYRHRRRNRRENSNQQNSGHTGEIILSDDDDDDEQDLSSAANRGSSTAISRNRRRFERLRRRRRSQRLMGLQLRHGTFDAFRHGYLSRMLLGIDRTRDTVNTLRGMLLERHRNISTTSFLNDAMTTNASSNSDAVIDLEESSTLGDDDVMVISESFEEMDNHRRNINNHDIVIDDDAAQEQDVIVDGNNSRNAINTSIILDDDI